MFILGIAGGSGSGKTYLAKAIKEALPAGSSAVIAVDSYYHSQDHLSPSDRAKQNYDHPDSLELSLLAKHLKDLRAGLAVDVPCYDYASHTRSSSVVRLEPCDFVVVEGILTYYLPEIRSQFDLKLFVDTPAPICLERRLARDTVERGRTKESILKQWESTVFPMYQEFCHPGKAFADLVWQGSSEDPGRVNSLCVGLREKLNGNS
jgi:uridine kinase